MATKKPFAWNTQLFLLLHSGSGVPYAARLHLKSLAHSVILAVSLFLLTSLGTLGFFRELELNRKLQDRVLELESREKLAPLILANARSVATGQGIPSEPIVALPKPVAPAPPVIAPAPEPAPDIVEERSPSPPSSASALASALGAATAAPSALSDARIAELRADCLTGDCQLKLSLVPVAPGVAQGQILIILETEMPRIGGANPTTQVRKRYFLYPGNEPVDDLGKDFLAVLERKSFRFSRVLPIAVRFDVGKLLRPLAANVYLFDRDRSLIHHERKVIETE